MARSRISPAWNSQINALLDGIDAPTPAFVWPADRAWCVTCDVDPHFATIGRSAEAIDTIVTLQEVDVVDDHRDRASLLLLRA